MGDLGSISGSGRSPGEENGNPLQYSCLENPHGQRSLVGYSLSTHTHLSTHMHLSTHTHTHMHTILWIELILKYFAQINVGSRGLTAITC